MRKLSSAKAELKKTVALKKRVCWLKILWEC